nr:MAG TPA: activating signal cointegrator [Caudoviricetes sp.]
MKVLASLKPYYYYLIGEKIKTLEIRKTKLKNLPQDVLFYMSKDEKSFAKIPKEFQEKYRKHFGKVGMEFTCDKVDEYKFHEGLTEFNSMGLPSRIYGSYLIFADEYKAMCLSYDEVKNYGKGRTLYGWHISDLKIYDKPKELSEFITAREKDFCDECGVAWESWNGDWHCTQKHCDGYHLSRPPQSYMFVEEVEQ